MSRTAWRSTLPTGALLALLLGAVVAPAVLALTVGILALALWREAFDIVFGVLVLTFGVTAIVGGVLSIAFLRRSARLADLQTEFVTTVSHELRTPLAGIRLMVETLALGRAEAPQQRREVLASLANETRRLEDLVERILDWRRLSSDKASFERQPLSVAALVAEAVAPFAASRIAGETPFTVSLAEGLPAVAGDRASLVGAIRNLVHNAIKFGGDRGPVEVHARAGDGEVIIAVRDRGPGIPVQERKRIFERFYRGRWHGGARQGTGLGLAIVRRVVEVHRGRLQLESEPGLGSTFSMHLPVAASLARSPHG